MKKLISLLLCLAMLSSVFTFSTWAEDDATVDSPLTVTSGDVNGDGKSDSRDAVVLLRRAAGWNVTLNANASDVNGDGKINSQDTAVFLKFIAGWNVTFAQMPNLYDLSFTKSRAELAEEAEVHSAEDGGEQPWNGFSTQFMYAPTLSFPAVDGVSPYKFTATDSNGNSFDLFVGSSTASIAPIWSKLAEGTVTVECSAVNDDGSVRSVCGSRTFAKIASFPKDVPAQAKRYYDVSYDAYKYIISLSFIKNWLKSTTPDASYFYYCYPSKTISEIINSMIEITEFFPDKAEDALTIAKNAANWLILMSDGTGDMEGVPPTYLSIPEGAQCSDTDLATLMTIYPAHMGSAYLKLYDKTGDSAYLDAAVAIGNFYKTHVCENGSWHLTMNFITGEKLSDNYCEPLERIVPFLSALYDVTGDKELQTLCDNAVAYVEKVMLPAFNWEAQFEDAGVWTNYENLTHYGAAALVRYYAENYPNDPEKTAICKELMRFIEDQFVVWTNPAPESVNGFDTTLYSTPCGLEQYKWYVPIDASTSDIMLTFLSMYNMTGDELYLAKALALANQITTLQNKNGLIPTHWMNDEFRSGYGFWLNCMCVTAKAMTEVSAATGEKRSFDYANAVERIKATELVLGNGSGAIITDDIVTALNNASYKEAKNIIFMIGDGMGFAQIMTNEIQYKDQLHDGKLAMNHMPVQSYQTTYCSDSDVTDSAAGGTALSTGYKTLYGTVGMNYQREPIQTTLELAAECGKSTGVVVTKPVTDATPADFTAHTKSRGNTGEIVRNQVDMFKSGALDLLLGGGWSDFDKAYLKQDYEEANLLYGFTFTKDFEEVKQCELPVLGLFSSGAMNTYDKSLPTIAEMTDYAITQLSKDENGFFLMVEGSQIDSGGHGNDYNLIEHETFQFDEAIAVALRFAALNPDTVIIITADHETGGLSFDHDATPETIKSSVKFRSGDHSGSAVPVRAIGYRTEELAGHNENAEVGRFVGSLLGNNDFGFASTRLLVEDFDGGTEYTFTPNDPAMTIGIGDLDVPLNAAKDDRVKNPRVLYLTVTNKGDTYSYAPLLYIQDNRNDYFITSQIPYIEAGQTVTLTYNIPSDFYNSGMKSIIEMYFCFSDFAYDIRGTSVYGFPDDYSYTLEFSDMVLVTRELKK